MSYISKEQVAAVRAALKAKFPKIKFSVVCERYSVLNVAIMSADIDFSSLITETRQCVNISTYNVYRNEEECIVDSERKFAPFATLFNDIIAIMKSQGWYDKSDAMTDYFHTAYYMNLSIGKWDKPYQMK